MENIIGNNERLNTPRIDIESLPWVNCSCGGRIFEQGVMVKKVSALLSPSAREEIVPAEVIVCKSCGKIPDFYAQKIKSIPKDMISVSTKA